MNSQLRPPSGLSPCPIPGPGLYTDAFGHKDNGCKAWQPWLAERVTTTRKEIQEVEFIHSMEASWFHIWFCSLTLLIWYLDLALLIKMEEAPTGMEKLVGVALRGAWIHHWPVYLSKLPLVVDPLLAFLRQRGPFRGAEFSKTRYSILWCKLFSVSLDTYHSWTFYIFWLWTVVTDYQNSSITIYKCPVYFSLVLVAKHWESWFTY